MANFKLAEPNKHELTLLYITFQFNINNLGHTILIYHKVRVVRHDQAIGMLAPPNASIIIKKLLRLAIQTFLN